MVRLPYQLSIVVQNNYAAPIACEGFAWGASAMGLQGWVAIQIAPIFAGMHGQVALTPVYGDYFVDAASYVYCRFM